MCKQTLRLSRVELEFVELAYFGGGSKSDSFGVRFVRDLKKVKEQARRTAASAMQ